MKVFTFDITEKEEYFDTVSIEAETEQEAEDEVWRRISNGEIQLNLLNSTYLGTDHEVDLTKITYKDDM